MQVFLALAMDIVSCRPEETAEDNQLSEFNDSKGLLDLFKFYGPDEPVATVELYESKELDELDENIEGHQEDSKFDGCPGDCVQIIDDFIDHKRENQFMYYYKVYRCTMSSEGCRYLFLDASGFRKRSKRDDSINHATKVVDFFASIGLFFANLFG